MIQTCVQALLLWWWVHCTSSPLVHFYMFDSRVITLRRKFNFPFVTLLVLVSLAITLCNHSAFFSVGLVALLICQWSETRAQAVAHCPRRGQASPWCHSILLQRSAILVKLTEMQEERAKLTKQFDKNQLRNLTICQPSQRYIEQIVLSFISYIRQCFIFTLVKGFALAL